VLGRDVDARKERDDVRQLDAHAGSIVARPACAGRR
jgi:hypothetical protein